jgi:ribosomal protein S12 methylthiotransferase accessory factor
LFAPDLWRSAPKAPGSFDRCVSLEATLALVPLLRERYGITRIADITHLDRIGIPVMSAIVPNSPDVISVYNGKGPTPESALAGAVMEAAERQVAAAPKLPSFMLDASVALAMIDPDAGNASGYDSELEVVAGYELLSGDEIFVPLATVQFPWPGTRLLRGTSTNGLAAGNTLAEAVYHALCELVERHIFAVAHARGYLRPRAIVSRFAGGALTIPDFTDDPVAAEIELPSGSSVVDALAERIQRAGLELRLRAVDLAPFPILLTATIGDPRGGPSAAHTGLGCSWSPEHAAIRALTEAAQSRAADFLGAREDLCHHDEQKLPRYGTRRSFDLPLRRWYYDAPAPTRRLSSFADRSTDDIASDVRALVDALRQAGVGRAAIVDLSPGDLPFNVVRAVAPRLEGPATDGHFGPTIRAILDLDRTPKPKPGPTVANA